MDKIIIAERYAVAPDEFNSISHEQLHLFRKLINRQFAEMTKLIYVDFVNDDPYEYISITEMFNDYKKGFIKVNTSGNDSKVWGTVYNLMFRAIHDIIHCQYVLDFNFQDETIAWLAQVKETKKLLYTDKEFVNVDWKLFNELLRSEICYQAACKEVTGVFHIDQKIILKDLTQ